MLVLCRIYTVVDSATPYVIKGNCIDCACMQIIIIILITNYYIAHSITFRNINALYKQKNVTSMMRPENSMFLRRSLAHISYMYVIFFWVGTFGGLTPPPPPYHKSGYATACYNTLWSVVASRLFNVDLTPMRFLHIITTYIYTPQKVWKLRFDLLYISLNCLFSALKLAS